MFLVDSHCHIDKLNYKKIHKNIKDVLYKADKKKVKVILSVCTDLSDFLITKNMIKGYSQIFQTCGIHPLNIKGYDELEKVKLLSNNTNVIAIGEIGLDFFYQTKNKKVQKDFFINQIQISKELKKPIVVHMRNSYQETLSILSREAVDCSGVIHCFNEDCEVAKSFIDLGFYISFSGIVTFKNSFNLQQVAKYVPLERILIETDSPYLTPFPFRGKENQPSYVYEIAKFIAKLRKSSLEEVATSSSNNFIKLFNISLKEINKIKINN